MANQAELTVEDSFGRTPLYLADEYGQTTVVDFLRVCERDLADPNSTFAQMRKAQQRGWVDLSLLRLCVCVHGVCVCVCDFDVVLCICVVLCGLHWQMVTILGSICVAESV